MWADYKAGVLNRFVKLNDVASVVEWGCGDGNQLTLAKYPRYLGLDVAPDAVRQCALRFNDDQTKSFMSCGRNEFFDRAQFVHADLALSLDVTYHLVELDVFESYLDRLFTSADRFVILYSTDDDRPRVAPHIVHRPFTDWVEHNKPDWELVERIERNGKTDPTETDFFIYARKR